MPEIAVIAGVGSGLSASLARLLAREGFHVVLAARDTAKLGALAAETKATAIAADVADPTSVEQLFASADKLGDLSLVVFNAAYRARGPVADIDPEDVRKALLVGTFGAFLVGQQAARRLLKRGAGSILFTGATAGVKGFANSSPFAMQKFGLRGLAQSMARELAPKNIHVAHFVIDGQIASAERGRTPPVDAPDSMLSPDAIADTYLAIHRQQRSAWTWEVELRPWTEKF